MSQVLFATGDTMAQQGVERRGLDKHDLARTGRMAAYGGCTSPLPPYPYPSAILTTTPRHLRPRRNKMVRLPRQARKPAIHKRHHPRARSLRPVPLRALQHGPLPLHHGLHGGQLARPAPQGRLSAGLPEELDGLAVGPVYQLQIRAPGDARLGC